MKTRIELAALGCLAMALAAPCAAQNLRVNVPFEFQAAGRLLPSGDYTVTVDVASRRIVMSTPGGSGINAMYLTTWGEPWGTARPSLTFHKYGSEHFLRQVRTFDYKVVMPQTKAERFAKRASTQRTGPELVELRAPAFK